MPLAAITPVLNDLLHKGANAQSSNSPNQQLQQLSNSNDSPHSSEYLRRESTLDQSSSIPNPLTSSSIDDVSI